MHGKAFKRVVLAFCIGKDRAAELNTSCLVKIFYYRLKLQ
jgi:uncharacterized metal-binding protein